MGGSSSPSGSSSNETLQTIDRAMARLMGEFGLAEGAAFVWLQREAMARRTPIRDVAEMVIAGETAP